MRFQLRKFWFDSIGEFVRQFIVLSICVATLILFKGYSFGEGNQVYFLPSIYDMFGSPTIADSWYMGALRYYHYVFKIVYVWAMRWVALPTLFFVSYCCTMGIFVVGVKKLCSALFKNESTFFYLFPLLVVGKVSGVDATVLFHANGYESLLLANALAVCSVALFFEDRLRASCIVAGVATAVHSVIGINVFLIVIVCFSLWHVRSWRSQWKTFFWGVLCFALVSAGSLAVTFYHLGDQGICSAAFSYVDFVRFRLPHHFVFTSFRGTLVEFGLLTFLGGLAFMQRERSRIDYKVLLFCAVIFLGCLVHGFFVEVIPCDFFVKFHFFRMTIFVALFYFLYVAQCVVEQQRGVLSCIVGAALLFCGSPLAAVFLMGILMICGARTKVMRGIGIATVGLFVFCGLAGYVFAAKHCVFLFNRFNVTPLSCVIALCGSGVGAIVYFLRERAGWRVCWVPLIVIFTVSLFVHAGGGRSLADSLTLRTGGAWQELCVWIREETDPNAGFIVPPYLYGFHLHAQRREFVDFKTGPWKKSDIAEWKSRFELLLGIYDLFAYPEKGWKFVPVMRERYALVTEKTAKIISKNYNIKYIICPKPKVLNFPMIYENSSFRIYDIQAEGVD